MFRIIQATLLNGVNLYKYCVNNKKVISIKKAIKCNARKYTNFSQNASNFTF